MNLNKYLNMVAGGAVGLLGGLSVIQFAHAQAAIDLPAGAHPTAARVMETSPPASSAPLHPGKPISDADLWQRVRRGFAMNPMDSPLVQDHEHWYSTRPDYIQRFVDRGSKYLYHVVEEVERRGMPTEVALLPIIESAFNPQAYSHAKASGMWQFIPSTGKNFGLKQDWMADNRRDVLLSTGAAMDYLQKLYGMFNSWELAFAAYNCGEGCVGRAIQKNQRKGLPTDFLSLNLPPETRNYVPKLIAVKNIILAPGSYGIELEAVENRPYFGKVAAPDKIDVRLAARLAEMSEGEFSALNPAFNRPVASSGTGFFLVPAEKAETFRENMELYRSLDGPMVSWQNASAKRGESVEAVAKRYGLTGSYLRATNISLPEKKGKFTQPTTFMVPMHSEAKIITATLDRKTAMKASQPAAAAKAAETRSEADAIVVAANDTVLRSEGIQSSPNSAGSSVASVSPAVVPATAPVAPVTNMERASMEPIPATYRVQPGDTLFSIARRFGITVDQVKAENRLPGNALQAGQTLRLAGTAMAEGKVETALVRASAPSRLRPASRAATLYTVRSGDSLFAIAAKFGVELEDLLRWNKLNTRAVIQPGLKIRVTA